MRMGSGLAQKARTGSPTNAAGVGVQSANAHRGRGMTDATPVYRALMLGCEERRVALKLPMEKFSEFAGLSERYYSKALYADQPSGRQASWQTMQIIFDALWPDGFEIIVKPKSGP